LNPRAIRNGIGKKNKIQVTDKDMEKRLDEIRTNVCYDGE